MLHEFLISCEAKMLKSVGASGQLSLGKKYAGQYFNLEVIEGGALLLKPMKVIPAGEAWVHEPGLAARLAAADQWMMKNPPAETNLDTLERKRSNPPRGREAIQPRKRKKAAA
jgi:hypothetical protein